MSKNDKKHDKENETLEITEEIQEETASAEQDTEEKEKPGASPLEEAEKRCSELNDRYLRLMAEYDNYRKRSTKEKSEIYPQAMAATVEKFLPVLDNLERARGFEKTTEEFAKGFDLICQSFSDVLKALNIEEIGVVGEPFSPDFHNAVMHIEDPELGENVVSQVLQKGYKAGGKVIRYAVVQTAN